MESSLIRGPGEAMGVVVCSASSNGVDVRRYRNKTKQNKIFRGSLAFSFLEALVGGARPMEIVASTE